MFPAWAGRTGHFFPRGRGLTERFSRVGWADRTFFPCERDGPDVFPVWAGQTGRFSRVGG